MVSRYTWLFLAGVVLLPGRASYAQSQDSLLAVQDRLAQPPELQEHMFYVSTETALNETERIHQQIALNLIIPSLSRQRVLERCLPQPVKGSATLYRLNLHDLGWSLPNWKIIVSDYPYHPQGNKFPLTVRADWLLAKITDASQSDAFYRLLLGARPTKIQEVFDAFEINPDTKHQYGLITRGSKVSKSGTRFIRNLASTRGWAYLTEDSIKLAGNNDPLKFPIGAYPHDGAELLLGHPKLSLQEPPLQGVFVVGFLFDGQGSTIDKADTALVEDYTSTRGFKHIVAGMSCFSCHATGPNGPNNNLMRDLLNSGVEAFTYKYGDDANIEAFHFPDIALDVSRDSEDYCNMIRRATGAEPEDAIEAFRSVLATYDADVSIERLAAETYVSAEDLPLAIGWMNANTVDLGGWLPLIAEGSEQHAPRETVEEYITTVFAGLTSWKTSPH